MKTLSESNPELMLEWDYSKNNIDPNTLSTQSHKKVWWKCNKADDHCWQATVQNRTRNKTTCPCCCNRKVVTSNCLSTTHPAIAMEWSKRNKIKPTEVTAGSNLRIEWVCDKAADHIWTTRVIDRTAKGNNCPFCYNKSSSINNISVTDSHIVSEWHPSKNVVTPLEINRGSTKKIWWQCDKGHEWKASPNNRISKSQSCPFCAGKKTDGSNSLLIIYPMLCREWDYERNVIDPATLLPTSHKRVHWICADDPTHRWICSPNSRVANHTSCPFCTSSSGEKAIRMCLKDLNVSFSEQYRFKDCKKLKPLPFDFAVHEVNLKLIEFHGDQHFRPINHFGGSKQFKIQLQRDEIKKAYCKNNNIPLLELTNKDLKHMPDLIKDFLL